MSKPSITIRRHGTTQIDVYGGTPLASWYSDQEVSVPGARFTPQYKARQWDGMYSPAGFLKRGAQGTYHLRCSRGLIGRLREHFTVLEDVRPPAPDIDVIRKELESKNFGGKELRDYQVEAIVRSLVDGWGRVALATNAGKGAVIAIIASILYRTNSSRTLILCDEIEVFRALVREIELWAQMVPAKVEAGVKEPPIWPFTVAMIPTLSRRLNSKDEKKRRRWGEWVSGFECVLIDEADKATSPSAKRVLKWARNSEWRIGFSGTFEDDNKYEALITEELMGPRLLEKKNIELVERGISARPTIELYGFDCTRELQANLIPVREFYQMSAADRRLHVFETAILHNERRHEYIISLIRPDIPTCIIVNRVEHGRILSEMIEGSVFLAGESSKTERDRELKRFQDGEVKVLVATRIFDRGSNRLGHAVDLIFASGEGSKKQTLQRIGRGLRRAGGKEFLRVVDIIDRGHKYLNKSSARRVKLYGEQEFDIEIVA